MIDEGAFRELRRADAHTRMNAELIGGVPAWSHGGGSGGDPLHEAMERRAAAYRHAQATLAHAEEIYAAFDERWPR